MDETQTTEDTICFGDQICLYSEDSSGFLFCYQSSTVHTELGVALNQNSSSPNVPNPHAFVFEICAQNRYKLNKTFSRVEERLRNNPNDLVLRNQYNQQLRASEAEQHENDEEQKRQQGKSLLYGQTIQLKHLFTGKYLHVNPTQTSWTETSNMMVELNPVNRKTSLFRILPRFKVKAEGEIIQAHDQIILESVKSPGQFIHCSRVPFNHRMVYETNFELNLSVRKSGFSIQQYYHAEKIIAQKQQLQTSQFQILKKIHAGAFLRLYHRELEAYLAAEGLFGRNPVESPHLRVRSMNRSMPKTLYPTTSAITFWQIEKESSTIDGSPLQWEEQCRLRHVTTRRYLKIEQNLDVTLTDDLEDPMTVFKIFPVVKLSDNVTYESYARFQHVVSSCWLANLPQPYVRKDGTNDSTDASSDQQWTRATLKRVGAKEEMMYDDAFSLQEVKNELRSDVNFVAGMAPFLGKFISDLNSGLVFTPRRLNRVTVALNQLGQFMIVKGQPCKPRQKLLRNFMIVDLLVELLQCPISGNENEKILTSIFALCYRVLYAYLRGFSSKNVLYMARHLEFFMQQLDCEGEIGVSAALMIKEFLVDNRRMVDRIQRKHIDKFCARLSATKDYRYLDLLITMCACDGIALPDNQKYITDKCLVEANANSANTIYYLSAGGKQENLPLISVDGKHTWQQIRDFAAKSEEDKSVQQFFLEYQLNLFSSLCFGRNDYSRSIITEKLELITWKTAFLSLCDTKIRDGLRASFCKLIFDLFIDVGENQSVLDNLNMVFVYADVPIPGEPRVRERNDSVMSSVVHLPFLKELKGWISNFLHSNRNLIASQIQRNILIEQVVRLIYEMTKFGYYGDTDDIKKLLQPLFGLLDGGSDLPFVVPEEENATTEIRQLIENYRKRKRYEQSIETNAIVNVKFQVLRLCELFFNFRFNSRLERFVAEFKQILSLERNPAGQKPELGPLLYENFELEGNEILAVKAVKAMKDMFAETKYFGKDFVDILLDCCKYKYDTLVTKSISLINRSHSAHENLFSRALVAQVVITEKSCKVLRALHENLPKFRLLGVSGKLNKENITKMKTILTELTNYCCLEDDSAENHIENQKLLYAFRVLADVFDILSRKLHNKTIQSQNEDQTQLFVMCFRLLKCMARGFPVVQERLFNRMSLLMKIENVEAEMADLFVEIFNGNEMLCLKIQSQQINELVALLAKSKNPVVIRLLSSLLLVDNIPLKRNQNLVLKALLAHRASIESIIDTNIEQRMAIITADESVKRALHLKRYFCNVVQLLSLCATGENKSTESICQCMFTVDDLLNIMNEESLCGGVRKGFVQFLSAVFLQSTTELADTDMKGFGANKKVWSYIDILCQELQTGTGYVKSDKTQVRSLLRKSPTRIHVSVADEVHERKELLFYLFDAALVFVVEFYQHYYDPQEVPTTTLLDMKEQEKQTAKLFSMVKEFAKTVHPCLTNIAHLQLLTRVLQTLGEALNVQSGSVPKSLAQGLIDPVSDAVKNHLGYYDTETELNKTLNVFAENMKICYGGFNSVSAQLGHHSEKPYYSEEHEPLPLGAEFQMLLRAFTDDTLDQDGAAVSAEVKYAKVATILHQLLTSMTRTKLTERQKLQQEELDVKCMMVLRALIHNEIVKLPDFTPETKREYRRQLVDIKSAQAALANLGIVDTVIPHLSRNGDSVPRETLALLATLLFRGCQVVQEKFMTYFLSTTEENFFLALKQRMEMSASNMKEQRHLLQKHASRALQEQQDMEKLRIRRESKETLASKATRPGTSFMRTIKSAVMGPGSAKSRKSLIVPDQTKPLEAFEKTNDELPLIERHKTAKSAKKQVAIAFDDENVEKPPPSGEKQTKVHHAPVVMTKNLSDDLSKIRAPSSVHLVLKVMALVCDGQNSTIQDYLREQKDNIKSINLVAECANYLSLVYSNITHQNINLASLIFDTLSEIVQGNKANQMVAFDNKISDYINHILKAYSFPGCALGEIYELKYQIGFLLKVLTEENTPLGVFNHSKIIMRAISTENLYRIMNSAYEDSILESLDRKTAEFVEQVSVLYHQLVRRSIDLNPEFEIPELPNGFDETETWKQLDNVTYTVELLKNGTLQKAYFFVENESVISEDVKERLKWNVDRSSPSNKLRDFLRWSEEIKRGLKYQRKVHSYKLGRFFINSWMPLNVISLFLTFAINACIVVSWVAPERDDPTYQYSVVHGRWKPTYPDWAKWTILVLALCHNMSALAILISYFLANRPALPNLPKFCRRKHDKNSAVQQSLLRVDFFGLATFYYLIYMTMSIFGTLWMSLFFSFHLLHLAAINQLLVRVIKAVTLNGRSLFLVACLGLVLFYIYSLLGFSFLRNIYVSNNLYCYTIWECFVSTLREGLLTSFGDRFEPNENVRDFGLYAAKAIFDVSFFILITTIGLNIIFGIIVDTFSELRDSKWHIENDMTGTCFMCNLTKYEFEHHSSHSNGGQGGFAYHVKKEHNMWSYLLFFIYLDDTPRNELSSLELYVLQMVEKEKTDFFPLGHALSLQKTEGDTTDKRIEILMEQVNKIVARIEEEENTKQREAERQRQENWQREHARKIQETVGRVKRRRELKVKVQSLAEAAVLQERQKKKHKHRAGSTLDTEQLEKFLEAEEKK